jgi:RNA polymerase sigma-70 factor (family 1)
LSNIAGPIKGEAALISTTEISQGGEAVFTRVFHAYYAKVYHYFLKKTRDAEMARELAQLSFIKLWQSRHTLSEEHSFDSQFFQIAATSLIDYLRRENTQRRKALRLAERDGEAVLQPMEAGAFEDSDYLQNLTNSLPPVRKKIFILSKIHGHSYKEIAEQLSISIKTVEDHMMKALRHIRSIASHLFVLLLVWLLY